MRRLDFNHVRLAAAIALAVGLVTVAVTHAQGQTANTNGAIYVARPEQGLTTETKDWNVRVGIPFWAAGTHGTIGTSRREIHLDQSFSDTLENLDFFAALNLEIRKNRWLFFSSGEYLKISASGEPRGLFGNGGSAQLGQKLMFNDLAIGYAV